MPLLLLYSTRSDCARYGCNLISSSSTHMNASFAKHLLNLVNSRDNLRRLKQDLEAVVGQVSQIVPYVMVNRCAYFLIEKLLTPIARTFLVSSNFSTSAQVSTNVGESATFGVPSGFVGKLTPSAIKHIHV